MVFLVPLPPPALCGLARSVLSKPGGGYVTGSTAGGKATKARRKKQGARKFGGAAGEREESLPGQMTSIALTLHPTHTRTPHRLNDQQVHQDC